MLSAHNSLQKVCNPQGTEWMVGMVHWVELAASTNLSLRQGCMSPAVCVGWRIICTLAVCLHGPWIWCHLSSIPGLSSIIPKCWTVTGVPLIPGITASAGGDADSNPAGGRYGFTVVPASPAHSHLPREHSQWWQCLFPYPQVVSTSSHENSNGHQQMAASVPSNTHI